MNMMTAAWLRPPEGPTAVLDETVLDETVLDKTGHDETGQAPAPHTAAPLPRLFQGLAPALRRRVLTAFTQEVFRDGGEVPSDLLGHGAVAVVLRGTLREDIADSDGTTRLIGLTFAGEVIAPLGPQPAATRLRAIGETVVMRCEAAAFDALLATVPALRAAYIDGLGAHFAQVRHWQVLLGSRTASERVASLMLWLRQRQGCPEAFALHVNRRELGQLTFLTLETVSRQMKALERIGAIALPTPSHVRICDPALLLAESGAAPIARCAA